MIPAYAQVEREAVEAHLVREQYYPVSGLPKRLQHCRLEHAETARRIYQAMTEELDRQMKGTILNYFATEGGPGWSGFVPTTKTTTLKIDTGESLPRMEVRRERMEGGP